MFRQNNRARSISGDDLPADSVKRRIWSNAVRMNVAAAFDDGADEFARKAPAMRAYRAAMARRNALT